MKKSLAFEIINYLAFILAISFGIYTANGQALFGANPEQTLGLIESLVAFGVCLVGFVPLLVINLLKKQYKPNWVLIGVIGLLIITLTIGLITFPDHGLYLYKGIKNNSCAFEYYISVSMRGAFIVQAIAFCLTSFILIDFPFQIFKMKPFLTILSILVIVAVLTFQIISFATEGMKYIEFFSASFLKGKENFAIKSAFVNSNIFAFILTIGIVAIIYMHYVYKKWFILLAIIPVYANIIFTICRSLIILDFVLIIVYLAIAIAKRFKHVKRIKTICFIGASLTLFLIAGVIRLLLTAYSTHTDLISFLIDDGSYRFLSTRIYMWKISGDCINFGNWGLGVGYNLFGEILFRMNATDLESPYVTVRGSHNFALEYIGNGGIIMFLIALALLIMITYLAIKSLKKNISLMGLCLTLIVIFTVYSFIESGSFILPKSYEFVAINLFIVSPILMTYKNKKFS